ncbi:MAG: glycosyltransferase [Anaerolineales bacterium]
MTHFSSAVSVIVPVWNDRVRLQTCLEAISAQTYPADLVETLVIDNGSADNPQALAGSFPRVQFLHEPRPGSYHARNLGVRHARGPVLAFTDSDCIPASDWIACAVKRVAALSPVGFVSGSVKVVPRDPARPTLAEVYDMVVGFPQEEHVEHAHFGSTCNLFTTAEVFETVGLFDSSLRSGGDADWGNRVYAAGRPVVYAEEVRILHPARRTFHEHAQRARRLAGGMLMRERNRPFQLLWGQIKELLPHPFFVRRILTSQVVRGAGTRALLLGVMMSLRYVKFLERMRVLLGGQPLR